MSIIPRPVRNLVEDLLAPVIQALIRAQVSPNAITTVSTAVVLGSGVAFGFGWIKLGGVLLLLSGIGDMLDGRVAREGGSVTPFGAFYDSTLDRIGDAALFGGIALYFARGGVRPELVLWALTAALIALSATLIVSYARARAEGLSLDCKVGIAQRAERILGLGIPSVFIGAGPDGLVLLGIVAVLAVLSVVTVGQRIAYVRKITRPPKPAPDDPRKPRTTQVRHLASDLPDYTYERNRK